VPAYTYVGDPDRYYPDLRLTANPGDTAEFDHAPDGRWLTRDVPAEQPLTRPAESPEQAAHEAEAELDALKETA